MRQNIKIFSYPIYKTLFKSTNRTKCNNLYFKMTQQCNSTCLEQMLIIIMCVFVIMICDTVNPLMKIYNV